MFAHKPSGRYKIRVGNGCNTNFWKDWWIGDSRLCTNFPRLYALENNKDSTIAAKLSDDFTSSYRREVRSGVESEQLSQLLDLLDTVVLSHANDRWVWDLNGTGSFQVKDARMLLDDKFLPKVDSPTRFTGAVLPIIRPSLGRQTSILERANTAMQEYLNHFLGNMEILNPKEDRIREHDKLVGSYDLDPILRSRSCKDKNDPRRYFEDYYSEDQYDVSIKEDMAYPRLHSPKTTEDKAQYAVSKETQYAVFKIWNEYNILEDIKRGLPG
ncbi:RNA-directed DNA polymerase, eukaryota, reverse transcriptase zinc-binding domain protein [Tanacetum coccineum]